MDNGQTQSNVFMPLGKTLLRFTFITSSNCSGVMRSSKLSLLIPALFTQTSMVPNSLSTSFTKLSQAAKSPALLW
jgi:hypothetical protein